MQRMKWVWANMTGHKWQLYLGYFCAIVFPATQLINPQISAVLIDRGLEMCIRDRIKIFPYIAARLMRTALIFRR